MDRSDGVDRLHINELDDEAFARHYIEGSRPLLIADGAQSWPATRKWSSPYLRQIIGDSRVALRYNDAGIFDYNRQDPQGRVNSVNVSVDEAISLIQSTDIPRHYIQQQGIRKCFPELAPDIAVPSLVTSRHTVLENLWFGAQFCKTPLHYDLADNLFSQIVGRKRVLLFAPHKSDCLYPAVGQTHAHCSRVNVFDPDPQEFPLFQQALPPDAEIVLQPGNMLYIPYRWWHAIESLDVSISVSIWWLRHSPPIPISGSP